MPTYNYYCPNCKAELELIHSMMDETEKNCPHCLNILVKKITSSTVIFKASGFYAKDNPKN